MSKLELGRSGSSFEINNNVLTKISPSQEYNSRLKNQYIRQRDFIPNCCFSKPDTFGYETNFDLHRFNMEYIKGVNFNYFCINSSTSRINEFGDCLLELFENNLNNSYSTNINFQVFENKILKMKELECFEDRSFDKYFKFLQSTEISLLPIGANHGDLAMANIIFSDKFYLIDFLDNLFDTPINDLVKIQQDSKHKFYLKITDSVSNKALIFLEELDKKIDKKFNDILNSKEYIYLSILNLLRIIPYVNKKEKKYIAKELKKYEYYITNSR